MSLLREKILQTRQAERTLVGTSSRLDLKIIKGEICIELHLSKDKQHVGFSLSLSLERNNLTKTLGSRENCIFLEKSIDLIKSID